LKIQYRLVGDKIQVFGDTYQHRLTFKNLGGVFDGRTKTWIMPNSDHILSQIQLLQKVGSDSPSEPLPKDYQMSQGSAHSSDRTPATEENAFLSRYLGRIDPPLLAVSQEAAAENGHTNTLTVSQLIQRVTELVQRGFPNLIWVSGETQNVQIRGRNVYFALAEGMEGANQAATVTASAIIFNNQLDTLFRKHGEKTVRDLLQDGIKIRCLCQVSVYRARANISLTVMDLDPSFTKGDLALARENLLRELRGKGLDRRNKSLTIPYLPLRIGLISAEGSRAQNDFLHQLFRGAFPGEVQYVPTPMQGEQVPRSVQAAIKILEKKEVDLIVITRGGGSAADLRWFDAPEIAYAIALCSVPVLSAIGHHDDYCVAEEISFERAKTPTAAAEFLLEYVATFFERTRLASDRLAALTGRRMEFESKRQMQFGQYLGRASLIAVTQSEQRLNRATASIFQAASTRSVEGLASLDRFQLRIAETVKRNIEKHLWNIDNLVFSLRQALDNCLFIAENLLAILDKKLAGNDPGPWLEKGWTQLYIGNEQIVTTASIKKGDHVRARLKDGSLTLTIHDVCRTGGHQNKEFLDG
jgi:exodeoxyribonuclease VII large subunit